MTYSFPNLESLHFSMSSSNCCFLMRIHVSQEAGKLFFRIFQFVLIHTVKGFSAVNKAEVDVFLEFPCVFYDATDIGNLISGPSAFSKSSWNIWKFLVHVLLKLSLVPSKHYCILCIFSLTTLNTSYRWNYAIFLLWTFHFSLCPQVYPCCHKWWYSRLF